MVIGVGVGVNWTWVDTLGDERMGLQIRGDAHSIALAGVHPDMEGFQSAQGKKTIEGGRDRPRSVLHEAYLVVDGLAITANRSHHHITSF